MSNIFNEKRTKKQTVCVALGVQLTRLLDLLLEWYMHSFQDRQMPLEERTTEWSHCVSFPLCHEDPLYIGLYSPFYRASICEGGFGSRNSVHLSVCPSVCLSLCHTCGL